ncbi:hypothetical protein [Ruegeria sp. HKCCD6109]|uniref:hypothetical protein n=1 Tax=Ruegeria sp. HKCCD6109 TaxID=2683017 RepID=UPI00149137A6|nr:hypothetical protein [Ruegeria sp. HKCCD6109]NOD65756.1 hypothetical protein [Ruegeria sp. HKCCD6109]
MNRREFMAGLATLAVVPKEAIASDGHGWRNFGVSPDTFLTQPPIRLNAHVFTKPGTYGVRCAITRSNVGQVASGDPWTIIVDD